MYMYIAFKTIVTGLAGAGLVCTFDSMNLGHRTLLVCMLKLKKSSGETGHSTINDGHFSLLA